MHLVPHAIRTEARDTGSARRDAKQGNDPVAGSEDADDKHGERERQASVDSHPAVRSNQECKFETEPRQRSHQGVAAQIAAAVQGRKDSA